MSSIPGIGLVLDADASSARREGHFFDLATARGDQLVMLEGAYADSLETAFNVQASLHPNDGLYGYLQQRAFRVRSATRSGRRENGCAALALYRLIRNMA